MKLSKIVVLFVLALIFYGCQKPLPPKPKYSPRFPDWQIVRPGGAFQMQIPSGMYREEAEGIDSFGGSCYGNGISLSFDYGWYSDPLYNYGTKDEYQEITTTINGQAAKIVFYRDNEMVGYKYHGAAHFPAQEEWGNKLTVKADFDDAAKRATVKNIFESIIINY